MQGLAPAAWPDALAAVKRGLEGAKGNEIRAIAGKLADAESMVLLKVNLSSLRFRSFCLPHPSLTSLVLHMAVSSECVCVEGGWGAPF